LVHHKSWSIYILDIKTCIYRKRRAKHLKKHTAKKCNYVWQVEHVLDMVTIDRYHTSMLTPTWLSGKKQSILSLSCSPWLEMGVAYMGNWWWISYDANPIILHVSISTTFFFMNTENMKKQLSFLRRVLTFYIKI
jgi:hypothetical protein